MTYYILDGRDAVRVTFEQWSISFGTSDRVVAKTELLDGSATVSTVFLGLDHQFLDGGPPHIFETMVFGGELDSEQDRYSTWAEAEAGHDEMVSRVLGTNVIPLKKA